MKILNIETRYDNCNLFYLNNSTVYNIIVFGAIYYDLNFKETTKCISSKDHLIECVLKWKKYSIVFYAKGSESYKNRYKVTILG